MLSLLVSLFSIVELVAQLDDVGKGSYEIKEALLYVALTVPERIGDLMPVSALLGGILPWGCWPTGMNSSPCRRPVFYSTNRLVSHRNCASSCGGRRPAR